MNRTRWCILGVTVVAIGAGAPAARAQQCPWLAAHHITMSQTQYHVPAQRSQASSYHSQAYRHQAQHAAQEYAQSLYHQHQQLALQRQEYQTRQRTSSESRSTTTPRQTPTRTQMYVANSTPMPGCGSSMQHSTSMHLVTQRTTQSQTMQQQTLNSAAQTSLHTVRQKHCKRHESQQVAMQQHATAEHHKEGHDKHEAGHDVTKTQAHHHVQMTCGRCHGNSNPLSSQPQLAQHQQHQHQQPQHQPQQEQRREARPEARQQLTDGQPRLPALALTKPYTLGQFYLPSSAVPPPLGLLPGKTLAGLVRPDEKPAADTQSQPDPALSMLAQRDVDAPALPSLGDSMLPQQAPPPAEAERGTQAAAADMSYAPALPPLPDASPDAPVLPRFPTARQ